jgi:hypothetical protein
MATSSFHGIKKQRSVIKKKSVKQMSKERLGKPFELRICYLKNIKKK